MAKRGPPHTPLEPRPDHALSQQSHSPSTGSLPERSAAEARNVPPRIRTYIPPSLLTETVLAQLAAVGKLSPAIAARAAGARATAASLAAVAHLAARAARRPIDACGRPNHRSLDGGICAQKQRAGCRGTLPTATVLAQLFSSARLRTTAAST